MTPLTWKLKESRLELLGDLEHSTLLEFWAQRSTLLASVSVLDISGVEKMDTAGLAMLFILQGKRDVSSPLYVAGISAHHQQLLELYNLSLMHQ